MLRHLIAALLLLAIPAGANVYSGAAFGGGTGFSPSCPSGLCDLNIDAARLTTWYPATRAEANYTASLSYDQYDVTTTGAGTGVGGIDGWDQAPKEGGGTLSSAGCSSASTATPANSNCMIANVDDAVGVRFVYPSGNWVFDGTGDVIMHRTNWVVLAGVTGTQFVVSIVLGTNQLGATGCSASGFNGEAAASAISVCKLSHAGTGVTWTSGFNRGDTVLGTATTAGFTVGQYVTVDVGKTGCTLLPNPTTGNTGLSWVDKVTAINAGVSITIERGLPYAFPVGCRVSPLLYPENGIDGAGIDNIDIVYTGTKANSAFKSAISITGAATDFFVVNSRIADFDNQAIDVAWSRGVWIRGNVLDDITHETAFNTTNIGFREGASDFVVEDNYCLDSAVCFQNRGSRGVFGYNYARQDGSAFPERSLFNHGNYAGPLLGEGNDVDQTIMIADGEFWGPQGPHQTFYRNRNTDAENSGGRIEVGDGSGSIPWSDPSVSKNVSITWGSAVDTGTETITKTAHGFVTDEYVGMNQVSGETPPGGLVDGTYYYMRGATADTFQLSSTLGGAAIDLTSQGTGTQRFSADPTSSDGPINVIANTMACYSEAGGVCSSSNAVNRNLNDAWIERNVAHTRIKSTTKATTGWGTTLGEAPPGNNEIGNGPHSEASGSYPNSFYRARTTEPSFWCDEACSWDYNGIGGFGDNVGAALCKLPAQLRVEDRDCTHDDGWVTTRNFNVGTIGVEPDNTVTGNRDGWKEMFAAQVDVYNVDGYNGTQGGRVAITTAANQAMGGFVELPAPLTLGGEIWFRVRVFSETGADWDTDGQGLKWLRMFRNASDHATNRGGLDLYVAEEPGDTGRLLYLINEFESPDPGRRYIGNGTTHDPTTNAWETWECTRS